MDEPTTAGNDAAVRGNENCGSISNNIDEEEIAADPGLGAAPVLIHTDTVDTVPLDNGRPGAMKVRNLFSHLNETYTIAMFAPGGRQSARCPGDKAIVFVGPR